MKPEKFPEHIMRSHLTADEIKAISGFLIQFQKTDIGWDAFRTKIPAELLSKYGAMVVECRRNGFVMPTAVIMPNGVYKILWSQILSSNPGNKCTMCVNEQCAGYEVKGNFKRCWEEKIHEKAA